MTPKRLKKVKHYRIREYRTKRAKTIDELVKYLMECDTSFDSIEKTRFFVGIVNRKTKDCRHCDIFQYGLNTVEAITDWFYIEDIDPTSEYANTKKETITYLDGKYTVVKPPIKWLVRCK